MARGEAHPELINLLSALQARCSLIQIASAEEKRVLQFLYSKKGVLGAERDFRAWSLTTGLVPWSPDGGRERDEGTRSPTAALERVIEEAAGGKPSINVFCDLDQIYDSEPEAIRLLREVARDLRGTEHSVILLSPSEHVPDRLESDVEFCSFPIPSVSVIEDRVVHSAFERLEKAKKKGGGFPVVGDRELRRALARAASGMTLNAADDALAKAVGEQGGLTWDCVDIVLREKRRYVRRAAGLEYIPVSETLDSVGGLSEAKKWFRDRQNAFSDAAREFGLEPPKGVLMLGLPGTGKSLAARALAGEWHLPLLRMDLQSIKAGIVGQSEHNLRQALRTVTSLSPAVLWIDEVEKALAGASADFVGDNGVAKGLFGMLLTWMAEQQGAFLYFTANDIDALPPELMRKGRIDEIFFVDAPSEAECREILEIHLHKRGRPPSGFDLDGLARRLAQKQFVGSEIEQVVQAGLYLAFRDRDERGVPDLQMGHLERAVEQTVPMAKSMEAKLRSLHEFVAEGRAVMASGRACDRVLDEHAGPRPRPAALER